ncbi:hypothetical protein GobsT_46790 [Gemmata obscuriglobus]|nr:hypothetical protein GobsT_46790 [Gemmata obscuriglobus]VTS09198.1 unnamed protein product [Gemmata obscuriglobus UQM 2246]
MRHKLAGGVRCSAGFGSMPSAVPRWHAQHRGSAEARPPSRPSGAPPTHPPCPGPLEAGTNRTWRRRAAPTTSGRHAEHHRPEPPCPHAPPATRTRTSRRRAAPDTTGTPRNPTQGFHHRGPHASHRRTRTHARDGCRTNSSPAPPSYRQRCVTNPMAVSGAAPGSARSRPRVRGTRRALRIRGSPPTGAATRSTADPEHRVATHRRPPTHRHPRR